MVLLQIYQKLEGGALGTQWEYKGNTLGLHLSHMPCPNMWACIIYTWAKGKRIHINLFVMKASIWEALEILGFFCENQNAFKKQIQALGCNHNY